MLCIEKGAEGPGSSKNKLSSASSSATAPGSRGAASALAAWLTAAAAASWLAPTAAASSSSPAAVAAAAAAEPVLCEVQQMLVVLPHQHLASACMQCSKLIKHGDLNMFRSMVQTTRNTMRTMQFCCSSPHQMLLYSHRHAFSIQPAGHMHCWLKPCCI
jgi:urease accessory protein UreF